MLELIAIGSSPDQRATTRLEPGRELRIGRNPQLELTIPWDRHLSRHHITLIADDDNTVRLQAQPEASNPVFSDGHPVTTASLTTGDFFVIG
ncbi:MAG TPA: hypothetical protein DCE39_17895, partial [Planctomycetaceae bacterium]|nr:hypothetical protein [Planctomycetaceae bacterium]